VKCSRRFQARNALCSGAITLADARVAVFNRPKRLKLLIEPKELAEWLKQEKSIRLLDVRSREEFEAVHIEGAILMSQPVMQQILAEGTNTRPLLIVDHQGRQGLDAAAYFLGHGLTNVRCLRGGIDAWSQEVDPKLPRYRLG
jgi:rhodanese-related sulfurtransferase